MIKGSYGDNYPGLMIVVWFSRGRVVYLSRAYRGPFYREEWVMGGCWTVSTRQKALVKVAGQPLTRTEGGRCCGGRQQWWGELTRLCQQLGCAVAMFVPIVVHCATISYRTSYCTYTWHEVSFLPKVVYIQKKGNTRGTIL